jgi:predicted MFS family arabinose efflux permease
MVDLGLFRRRNFTVGNAATFAIYAGLTAATFMLTLFLQQVVGYDALAAGMALMPVTLLTFLLAPRFGRLAGHHGPRAFMTLGPIVAGAGLWMLGRMGPHPRYVHEILPGMLAFGLGLSATAAPLTAAVLGGVDQEQAGIASAINNAVARVAGLIAIAAVGARPFDAMMAAMAALLWAGGLISGLGIRRTAASPRAG